MVIDPKSSVNVLSGSAAQQAKLQARRDPGVEEVNPDDEAAPIDLPSRSWQLTVPEIPDEQAALDTTQFARSHILTYPSASLSVQANTRPETVFELLQGILG